MIVTAQGFARTSIGVSVLVALVGCACGGSARVQRAEVVTLAASHDSTEPSNGAGGGIESPAAEPASSTVAPSIPVERSLGTLPSGWEALTWPARPRLSRERTASTTRELQAAVDEPGTRVRVTGHVQGAVVVHASDVEIDASEGHIDRLVLAHGVARVRVHGGRVDAIELPPPARWNPDARYDESLFATDVTIDGVRMVTADTALLVRGRRVAVLDCDITAERYSLWAGDTGPLDGSDLIVAGNTMRSAGPESTLRMHDVRRSVVVDNVLSNGAKHDYRVHGRSDLAYAARNVLLHTGIMIGNQPGDRVGRVVFEDNVLHHAAPSLLEIDFDAIAQLEMRRNVVYTDVWTSFYPYPRVAPGWSIEENVRRPFEPYRAP